MERNINISALWIVVPSLAGLAAMLLTGRAVTCSRMSSRLFVTREEASGCYWLWVIILSGTCLLGLWDLLKT